MSTATDTACPLQMSRQEYDDIRQCEAVIVREYEAADGSRFAKPVAWGDMAEMQEQAAVTGLFIVPPGVSIVGHWAIAVSDLIPNL